MVDSWTVSDDKLTYVCCARVSWRTTHPCERSTALPGQALGRQGWHGRASGIRGRIEAVDDNTFKLVLKQPVGFVLGSADGNVPFDAERIASTDPNTQITGRRPGPFRFVKEGLVPGSKATRNSRVCAAQGAGEPRPAARLVKVDRVDRRICPMPPSQRRLRQGELDLLRRHRTI
jgi:hypothetical protein